MDRIQRAQEYPHWLCYATYLPGKSITWMAICMQNCHLDWGRLSFIVAKCSYRVSHLYKNGQLAFKLCGGWLIFWELDQFYILLPYFTVSVERLQEWSVRLASVSTTVWDEYLQVFNIGSWRIKHYKKNSFWQSQKLNQPSFSAYFL